MPISFAVVENGALRAAQGVDAPVPWWSFTKTVIAAAALALVRDARLQLDRPLPNRPFTLRQLLAHRAGVTNYGGLAAYGEAVERGDEPWPISVLLERAHAARLRYPPGQGWAYSNIGYLFVRELIEETCRETSRHGPCTAGAASTRHSPSAAGAAPRRSRRCCDGRCVRLSSRLGLSWPPGRPVARCGAAARPPHDRRAAAAGLARPDARLAPAWRPHRWPPVERTWLWAGTDERNHIEREQGNRSHRERAGQHHCRLPLTGADIVSDSCCIRIR